MSYTTSKAQSAIGVVLSIGPIVGTATPTYTPIFELTAAPISGRTWTIEEVTNFNSGYSKEYIKTLLDQGKVNLSGNRVSTDPGQVALQAAFLDNANAYLFKLTYPLEAGQSTTGDSETFGALVLDKMPDITMGKTIKMSCSLQITGTVTYTEGA